MIDSDSTLMALEQRVERLEEAVSELQNGRVVELPQVKAGPLPPPDFAALPPPVALNNQSRLRPPWLLVDILHEGRAMVRMFFDIHYRMTWYTRIAFIILMILMFTSNLWLGWVPLLGTILVKLWDLVMAFLIYKILSREARRYRETVPK